MNHLNRIAAFVVVSTLSGTLLAAPLKRDEQVLFAPRIAHSLADGRIAVDIEAWVHERETRPGSNALFARWLGLDRESISAQERAMFDARTQLFRVDSERRKHIRLRFADDVEHELPATGSDGRSVAQVSVDGALLGADQTILFDMVMPTGDPRRFGGRAIHVPARGLSVVSDIDDTIKQSNVRDRRELMLNTFARTFKPVPGMAATYRELVARDPASTRIHYVSASPLQLLPPISEFLQSSAFPDGSVHLRPLTSLRTLLRAAGDSSAHKLDTIRALLRDFPQRTFVLVGDSGEHDPEIYATLAREFNPQVVAVVIRNVSGEARDAARYAEGYAGLRPQLLTVFVDTDEWSLVNIIDAASAQ